MLELEQKAETAELLANNTRYGDGIKQGIRVGTYGEIFAKPIGQAKINLAGEGSYFTVNNGQTGLATAAAPTTFSATNPFIVAYNKDAQKNAYLDYAALIATAAGTAGASVQAAITLDTGDRYASGGSDLSGLIANCNGNVGGGSILKVFAGNITASTPSGQVRTLLGQRALKGAIPVIGDNYMLKFGSDDCPIFISTATLTWSSQPVPPIVIGPNQSALIHLWLPSQSAASSYIPELGWFER